MRSGVMLVVLCLPAVAAGARVPLSARPKAVAVESTQAETEPEPEDTEPAEAEPPQAEADQPAASEDAAAEGPGPSITATESSERLQLGSYGRVGAGSNLLGQSGEQVRTVSHPPRLLEASYMELDLRYAQAVAGAQLATQLTLAFGEQLFHLSGDFAADLALRNLYVEVKDALPGLSVWGGSRMLRGDAIYLFDFWPLDEQNTVGGGAGYRRGDTTVSLHAGLNRLDDPLQLQTVTAEDGLGTREFEWLDRPRAVGSARAERHIGLASGASLVPVIYAEVHRLPSGERRRADGSPEALPDDSGWLTGAELRFDHGDDQTMAFVRYGRGLAAYDELSVPFGVGTDGRVAGARELLVAVSTTQKLGSRFGVMAAGYARNFVDADPNRYDLDDGWETAVAVRPAWFVTEHLHLLAEASLQHRWPNGLNDETGRHEQPMALQFGLMPAVSLGRQNLARPEVRLVAAATVLNEAARLQYAPDDPQRQLRVQPYFGVAVEWWFSSSRYGDAS